MANVDVTRIASNIGALNALNSLMSINKNLAIHQTRLSTGKRINSAEDDPAGLTIANKMLARSEGLRASLDNIGDAKNMLAVAEGGMSKMTDIMVAMRNKAEQAASDTLGNSERAAIQTQVSAFAHQIQDLVDQTKWNDIKLLDNSKGSKTFQTGVDQGETVVWNLPGALDPASMNLSTNVSVATATATNSPASFGAMGPTGTLGNLAELSTGDYNFTILDKATSDTIGKTLLDTNSNLITGMTGLNHSTTQSNAIVPNIMTSGEYSFEVTQSVSATDISYKITKNGDTSFGSGGSLVVNHVDLTQPNPIGDLVDPSGNVLGVNIGTNLSPLAVGQSLSFEYIAKNDAKIQLKDAGGEAQQIAQNPAGTVSGSVGYAAAGGTYNSGRGVTTTLAAFGSISPTAGSVQTFTYERVNNYSVNLSNAYRAGAYMTTVDTALDKVTSGLSDLGSLMARLSFKEEQSATAQVNVEGAYSRIMNANMAEEQMSSSKYTILQQTATAMLSQANAAPQTLLSLFK